MEGSIFNLMSHFWRENEKHLFSAKEAQLYFFLLSEYYRLRRENPYLCSTQRITNNLGISRQTLIRLREKLQVRGLLTYKEGKNLSATPCYSLLLKSDNLIEPRNGVQDGTEEAIWVADVQAVKESAAYPHELAAHTNEI